MLNTKQIKVNTNDMDAVVHVTAQATTPAKGGNCQVAHDRGCVSYAKILVTNRQNVSKAKSESEREMM